MFKKVQNIHFVGIGGSGMSGIAEVLINLGHKVSGSDLKKTEITKRLQSMGAKIYIGHDKKNISKAKVIVISTAVSKTNPEVLEARSQKIPVIRRVEMLAELARLKYCLTIAGTHGKTTTTSMTAMVLSAGGLDPTIVVGGRLKNINAGAYLGKGDFLVAEADESDGSFLRLSPAITVVTNIDNDHLDYYKSMDNLKKAFVEHINSVPFYGAAIICSDDKNVREIIPQITRKYMTYGFNPHADLRASNVEIAKGHIKYDIFYMGKRLGKVRLRVPGRHNVLNSLAAAGAGLQLDIPFQKIIKGIYSFDGVGRRLEIKGEKKGILVIDDYGHHPTEIKATINAIKKFWPKKKLRVLFQPHRYTRTRDLFEEFGKSFLEADFVHILDIYPAGEQPIEGVSSGLIYESVQKNGGNAQKYEGIENILRQTGKGEIILTLGAGDIWKEGEKLLSLI
ncbi:MAG: UDP-N-acetylmuramate--L-alanine ligase [Elusimicrobiota bacterium]|nr:UDP-N-acetylmuramate--L-alanine ligase [Elusimicrobiota bacterium]